MKDLALLVIRIVTGGSLISHGYPKLFGGEGKEPPEFMTKVYGKNFPSQVSSGGPATFAKHLEGMNVPYPQVAAYLAGAAEFGGGLALLTGFRTRLAALVVLFNMGVAIKKVHWETGFSGPGGFELAMQVVGGALALLIAGPGAFSVDGIIGGAKNTADAAGSAVEAIGSATSGAAGAVGGRAADLAARAPRPFGD
jgi:putative oxidoreductase